MPRWAPLSLAMVLLVAAPFARAQPADPTVEEARAHFEEGVRRYDKRDFEGALAEFRAAYDAHPSPAILRNVALSLKALGRNAEAIEALERMLSEGSPAPGVRQATARTLDELRAAAATVRVRVVFNAPPGTVSPQPVVALDGRPIPAAKMLQPVWVDPGPHTITASASGFTDAAITVVVKAGDREAPADVSLLARAALVGTVAVHATPSTAKIAIDGALVGHGEWRGPLAPGKHVIEASAEGMRTALREIDLAERGSDEVTLALSAEPRLTPGPLVEIERHWFAAAHVGLFGGELPIRSTEGGPRPLVAATVAARFGRKLGPYLAVEIDGELQAGGTPERVANGATSSFTMTHAAIGAGARLSSATQPRLTIGGVGGFVNQSITSKLNGIGDAYSGGAPTGFLQVEGGFGVELSKNIDLEVVALVGLLGVNASTLSGSVMGRYGGRAGILFKF